MLLPTLNIHTNMHVYAWGYVHLCALACLLMGISAEWLSKCSAAFACSQRRIVGNLNRAKRIAASLLLL